MQKLYDFPAECFGCGACAYACSTEAIKMEPDKEGFVYPAVDETLCTDCGICREVCPIRKDISSEGVRFYALRCKDPDLLSQSTSGGAFSVIASQIIKNGGLVCGAVFDETFTVRHILSGNISPMRKSKYVQSSLSDSFQAIEEALAAGTQVLFSGTPCQCHAMKQCFPGNRNLLTMTLICRGVMSPLLWEEYCRYLEKDGTLTAFCFRDKRRDNDAHTVAYMIGGKEHTSGFSEHPLTRIYTKELSLRPSCYHCPYVSCEKDFDFTIGDFWGAENVFPEYADGKGLSLVITGGLRAEEILNAVQEEAFVRETTKEKALQPALTSPAKESMLRKFLFRQLETRADHGHCDMETLLKIYGFKIEKTKDQ